MTGSNRKKRRRADEEVDPGKAYRLFYPQVPCILSASSGGRTSAMPVVSFAWLSSTPPMVGVSCMLGGTTLGLAVKSRAFSLCWLDSSEASAVSYLATHSGKTIRDKLRAAGLAGRRGTKLDVPVIGGSAASLECRLVASQRYGDHRLIVGRVEAARAIRDFKEYWRFREYSPLLYTGWQGRLSTLMPKTRTSD